MRTVFVLAETCPLGCGPVIFVKTISSHRIFVWCDVCGLAWSDPRNEAWHLGDVERAEIHACLIANDSNIEAATKEEINAAGLADLVVSERTDAWSSGCIDRYNAKYACDPNITERARILSDKLREMKKW
jgi:hypothetical protein